MSNQKLGESALKRRTGDAEHAAKLNQHFESQNDLYAFCPHCKNRITGSMAQLKGHIDGCTSR